MKRFVLLAVLAIAWAGPSVCAAQYVRAGGCRPGVSFYPRTSSVVLGGYRRGVGFSSGYPFSYCYGFGRPVGYRYGFRGYGYGYPFGFRGYGFGYGYSYGYRVRGGYTPWRNTPSAQPYPYAASGHASYTPPVYSIVAVPSADGGRPLAVDMIRGGRSYAPAFTFGSTAKAPPVDPDSVVKPQLTDETLTQLLAHSDPSVRRKAAETLLDRGVDGYSAVRRAAETAPSPGLRSAAVFVLTRAATSAPQPDRIQQALQTLVRRLSDSSPQVRQAALECLSRLPDRSAEEAIEAVVAALRDENPGVRQQAVALLVQWRDSALEPLVTILTSQRDLSRNAASQALGQLGVAAVGPLAALLDNPQPSVRFSAASALGDIGVAAAPARASLRRLAESDPDANVRYYARTALARIEP